ncbi:hypothetical protein JTB14_015630 [Gonioctena quinquepunctata]|nr:hypothetical protein JTB14_015630 [Gonioctena quinquepunctata]
MKPRILKRLHSQLRTTSYESTSDSSLPDIDTDKWQKNLLADPSYNGSVPIDIILGADKYGKIILEGLKKVESGLLGKTPNLVGFCR